MKKKIILVATGSVAIIKFEEIKDMLSSNFDIKCLATPTVANYFNKSYFEKFNENIFGEPDHIRLAKWADQIVVVPATLKTMAKFKSGISDNFVMSVLLAARQPIMFVPAMNTFMYEAAIERDIISFVEQHHLLIEPVVGMLREKEIGMGRMQEPAKIVKYINNVITPKQSVIISYGSSKIYIDNIRYFSSGSKGGIAKALRNELKLNGYKVKMFSVENMSNEEIVKKVNESNADWYISPAAISDFKTEKVNGKIHKRNTYTIELKRNIDVISHIKNKKIIGFKLDDNKQNAINKKQNNNLEIIVWNKLDSIGSNKVTGSIITTKEKDFNDITKTELAKRIVKEM